MNYSQFLELKQLVEEREQLKKGLTLLREMALKSSSLESYQAKLVFTESISHYQEGGYPPQHPIQAFFPFLPMTRPAVEHREKGLVVLDDILILKVSGAMADYWEERIKEINAEIKSLGLDP